MKFWPHKPQTVAAESHEDTAVQPVSHSASWQAELRALAPTEQVQLLHKQLLANPSDLPSHERLHRLLSADPGTRNAMLVHARDYLGALVVQSRGEQAYALFEACLGIELEFQPHADHVLGLARLALLRKDSQQAMRIMRGFDCGSDHPHAPEICFLTARVLRDEKQFAKALNLLDSLLARYPLSPVVRDAQVLQRALRHAVHPPRQ